MALHFSANQYEKEFHPKRLQNWEVPKVHREEVHPRYAHLPDVDSERPRTLEGFTQIIGNDRGHLLPGVKRSLESPWGNFVGTWDMPSRLPGNCITNPTARSSAAVARLDQLKEENTIRGKTPVNHKIDMTQKASDSPKPSGSRPASCRSGARTPEPPVKTPPQSPYIPIPTPDKAAIYTPNMDDVTRPRSAKSVSPLPETRKSCSPVPSPKPTKQELPDNHHFGTNFQ